MEEGNEVGTFVPSEGPMPGPMKITTIKEGGIKRECVGVVATL